MENVSQDLFELKLQTVDSNAYMHRVYEVNMPCQWLDHCYGGKCPGLKRKNGNLYCAMKKTHW